MGVMLVVDVCVVDRFINIVGFCVNVDESMVMIVDVYVRVRCSG